MPPHRFEPLPLVAMRARRRPVLAAFLSLALPGLGQLYNGRRRRAVVFFAVGAAIWAAAALTPLMASVAGVLGSVAGGAAFVGVAVVDAFLAARRLGAVELDRLGRWYVYLLVYLGAWVLSDVADRVVTWQVGRRFESFSFPSGSMIPTLEVGDVVYAGPLRLTGGAIGRGEVVVFRPPGVPDRDFAKRVVGLAGDVVEMREGRLVVNDHPVDRCHLGEHRSTERDALTGAESEVMGQLHLEHIDGRTYRVLEMGMGQTAGPERVPPGHVYVVGDNRDNSHDSRRFGSVPVEDVTSRALFLLYSSPPGGGLGLGRAGRSPDDLAGILAGHGEARRRCRAEGCPG